MKLTDAAFNASHHNKEVVTPFWNIIPHFFLYGVKPRPLLLAGALGGICYALDAGLFSLVLAAVILKYSMVVLQRSAMGDFNPPEFSYEVLVSNYELPFKLYALVAFFSISLSYASGQLGTGASLALLLFGFLMFPALVITLAYTESFFAAINPLRILGLAIRIGWPYWIMFIFLTLFEAIEQGAQYFFYDGVSGREAGAIFFAFDTVFSIIVFHLMGYVLYQFGDRIGVESPKKDAVASNPSQVYTSLLEKFIGEGKIDAAIMEFEDLLSKYPDDLQLKRRFYTYLLFADKCDYLTRYVPGYFDALFEARRVTEAAQIYLDTLERKVAFQPGLPKHYLPLMKILKEKKAYKQAVLLAKGFHKKYPQATQIPLVYLEMAEMLCENLNRDDLALQTLTFLDKHYAGHEINYRVKQYINALSNI